MLEVSGLDTYYGTSQALFGMRLHVNAGEFVTLLGRNGMGKTTTINSIMGILKPVRGDVKFDQTHITGAPPHRIAQMGLGLVPEGRQVFPNLTVHENLIATAANRRNDATPWTIERIYQMFPSLLSRRALMGNLLSGGEQQMLAIGRALMTNPRLLVLDEATEGLAPLIRQEIWACLQRIKGDGLSILVVDKNVADLVKLADRHFVIEKGQVVWSGSSQDLLANEDMQHRYLGV
jgi:branched-chain amino acid transport system ATP-binding protein